MSFGALIKHKKFQHDSAFPSWSKFDIEFTIGTQKHNILKKALYDCRSAKETPLFNSNRTKVSVLKWSQN